MTAATEQLLDFDAETPRDVAILPQQIRTRAQLYWATQRFFGSRIPRYKSTHPECATHVSPFTAFADAFFAVDTVTSVGQVLPGSIALWHGSRGLSGKSFALSTLGLSLATFLGSQVNLLGGSFEQSANIKTHMEALLDHPGAPAQMVTVGARLMRFSNHAWIKPLTASQKTVRGPHPQRLLLDEIDEMDIAILDSALGQPMERPNYLGDLVLPYTVMCSTWQNPEGTFTEVYRRAEEQGFPRYTWCYRDSANERDGWLSQRQIEEKKRSIPKEMWRVEYELGEPSIGNRAIDTDCVDAMFCLPFTPIAKREESNLEEYVFERPILGKRYVAAADWAKEQDYTVITVWRVDTEKVRLVYYMRVNRRPYPMMTGWFNDAMTAYRTGRRRSVYDGTGVGSAIEDYVSVDAWPFKFTGESKAAMLTEYVAAVEHGLLEAPRIPSMYTEHKFARTGDLYSSAKASGYHLPDTISSAAMAFMVSERKVQIAAPLGVSAPPNTPSTYMGKVDRPAGKPGGLPAEMLSVEQTEATLTDPIQLPDLGLR